MGWLSNLFGGSSEDPGAQRRTTLDAGSVVQDSIEAYGTNREQIGKQFKGQVSSARARMGASGATMEGSAWQNVYGSLVRGRDEALGKVQAEEDTFREGTAFKLVHEDFDRMGSVQRISSQRDKPSDYDPITSYRINTESSVTGESYFTDKQKGMLYSSKSGGAAYQEYAASIRPSFEEYEKFRFGSDQEKADFSDSMTARIEASNIKYKRVQQVQQVTEANKRAFGPRQTDR